MKRVITILFVLAMSLVIIRANAQARAHGNEKHEWKKERGHSRNHHDKGRYDRHHGHKDHHHHSRQRVRHVYTHHHSAHCDHRIIIRHYERPRYVYYRDHDLYFDHHRNVYISYSGRNWTVSANLPVHLHHVNLRSTAYQEVDYYEDDFATYLDRGRPIYRKVVYAHR